MNLLSSKLWQGQILVRAHNWSYIIDKKPLWQTASFSVKSGDKLAIIGPNGCGKTTLLKQFLKAHNKHLPNVQIAGGAKIGYFSQDIDILDPDKNLLRNLQSTSSQSEALLRTVLIRLRFKREDFFKPIQLLSGGEKVKAALAKILVSDCNVLMLDEPTNHLDLDAVTALEELLCNYPGTLIFTTHDRRLLKAIAKNLLVFDGTKLNFFPGPYDDYSNKQISTEYIEATADILLIENKLAEIISHLSLNPTEKLEAEFQSLLAKKRLLLSKQSS
jgi:pleuromutilin/lincosamide/streptogramin A transport system ATP-binding/permease protein